MTPTAEAFIAELERLRSPEEAQKYLRYFKPVRASMAKATASWVSEWVRCST